MKPRLLTLLLLCIVFSASAQIDYYQLELRNLFDVSRLPLYRTGEIEELSSYDRTGLNDDGFTGKYSAIRKDKEGWVIADLKGPGLVNRIWTPTPEVDTLSFYFDGEQIPRISIPFKDLFTGQTKPFVSPLCATAIGGYYCYLPISYEKSLKIVYKGNVMRFFQIQYRTLDRNESIKSFTINTLDKYKNEIGEIEQIWNKKIAILSTSTGQIKAKKISFSLKKGAEQTIYHATKGGRIIGIELSAGSALVQAYRKIMLTANWDNETKNALELPLHDFFGFAFGKPAMQSMLLGSNQTKLYSYLPMPYDNSAIVKLKYDKSKDEDPDEILVSGTVYYTERKRNVLNEGKLYAQSRRVYNGASSIPHTIADIKGKGHFIGTILIAQGLEEGHTLFFEGDDVATIDGKMKLHGTGSEDYFNGGYYAILDKWDRGISLPIHGSLAYDQMTSRTGGYRFYLNDKLNFNKNFKLTIEHQPEDKVNVLTDYTSVGLFYAEKPQFSNTEIRIDEKVTPIKNRNKLTPQGMLISLYWFASAKYDDDAIIFDLKHSDSWTTTIDAEAMPVVQINLPTLDSGRYKLYVEYGRTENSGPFSVWQRLKPISEWIPVDIETSPEKKSKVIYAGDIDISEELKTITLRKKIKDDVTIKIYSLIFERTDKP